MIVKAKPTGQWRGNGSHQNQAAGMDQNGERDQGGSGQKILEHDGNLGMRFVLSLRQVKRSRA